LPHNYSDTYKIRCRAIWYDNGCPSPKKIVEQNLLPPDESGETVGEFTLGHWLKSEGWYEWKGVMDAELSVRVEEKLLDSKIKLIEEQLEQNNKIRNKAFEDIKEKGFDSTASAVSAFFKASAEERGLMQIQKVIEDLSRLQTGDLQQKFRELAERAGATVDGIEEKEEVAEPLD
jgi:hypothetical protein